MELSPNLFSPEEDAESLSWIRCLVCGYSWKRTTISVPLNESCPRCTGRRPIMEQEEYVEYLKKKMKEHGVEFAKTDYGRSDLLIDEFAKFHQMILVLQKETQELREHVLRGYRKEPC